MFITSAEYAGVFVVWAVTDKAAQKGKGITTFLVENGIKGFTVGRAEHKMGQHASVTNELIFEDCRIPKDAMMGKLNDGFRIAVGELAGGRIGIGSLGLGSAWRPWSMPRSTPRNECSSTSPSRTSRPSSG